jgi:hypothetical protein
VIGCNQTGEPEQREVFAAGGFELACRAQTMEVAVEPDFEQEARRIRRTALDGGGNDETQGGQIELVDELAQKARGMIGGDPVFERRRKKKLLSVVGAMAWAMRLADAPTSKEVATF